MKQVLEELKLAISNYDGPVTHCRPGKARAKPLPKPDAADKFLVRKNQEIKYKSQRIEKFKSLTYREKITIMHKKYLDSQWVGKIPFYKWLRRRRRLMKRSNPRNGRGKADAARVE